MKPLNPFPPTPKPATLSGFSTSPLLHSAHRGTNSPLVPLKTKIPSPKWSKRVYLGTTANVRWLITMTSTQEGEEVNKVTMNVWIPSSSASSASYLTLWDMCRGVSISSKMAPFTLDPLKFASCRSQPDRSQFWWGERKMNVNWTEPELCSEVLTPFPLTKLNLAAGGKPAMAQMTSFLYTYIYL